VFLVAMIVLALLVLPPWLGLAAVVLAIVVEVAEVAFWIRFLRRYRVRTGAEGLVGSVAEVVETLDPEGRVRLRGEIWRARGPRSTAAAVGQQVEVTGVDGLTLEVGGPAGVEPTPGNGKGPL
jgi:membrane protein implicated in regulation of membrane protease activity